MALTVADRWKIVARAIAVCKHFEHIPNRDSLTPSDTQRAAEVADKIETFIKHAELMDGRQLLLEGCRALGIDPQELQRLLMF